MYYLLLDYGQEGWSVKTFDILEDIKTEIEAGHTFGNPFMVVKEIPLILEDPDDPKS